MSGTADSMLVTLTVGQLRELVAEAIRLEVLKAIAKPMPEVLTLKQCAELLDRTTKTVMKLVQEDGLPAHYISEREPRFRLSEVLAWLSARPSFAKEIAA